MFKIFLIVVGIIAQGPQPKKAVSVIAKSKVFTSAKSCEGYIKNNSVEIQYAAHSRGRKLYGLKYKAICARDESGEIA